MHGSARCKIVALLGACALIGACGPPREPDVPEEPDVTKPPPPSAGSKTLDPAAPAEGTEAPSSHGAHP
jgi:hypothetical protein